MTPETALAKRQQMLGAGYCIIEDIVTEEFLEEMRRETERLIANHEEPPDLVYQGQHIGVKREDNAVIYKLLGDDAVGTGVATELLDGLFVTVVGTHNYWPFRPGISCCTFLGRLFE